MYVGGVSYVDAGGAATADGAAVPIVIALSGRWKADPLAAVLLLPDGPPAADDATAAATVLVVVVAF